MGVCLREVVAGGGRWWSVASHRVAYARSSDLPTTLCLFGRASNPTTELFHCLHSSILLALFFEASAFLSFTNPSRSSSNIVALAALDRFDRVIASPDGMMSSPDAFGHPGVKVPTKKWILHIVRIVHRDKVTRCSSSIPKHIQSLTTCRNALPSIPKRLCIPKAHNPQTLPSSSSLHSITSHFSAPSPTTSRYLSITHSAYIAAVAFAASRCPGVRPAFSASTLERQTQVARFRPLGSGVPNQYLAC